MHTVATGADILHRIVDREAGRHDATRRVDVEIDVFVRVIRFQEQQLGANQARYAIVDRPDQKDDPLFEQTRINVVGALPTIGLLDHHGDQGVHMLLELLVH